jgi:hypothetical protein
VKLKIFSFSSLISTYLPADLLVHAGPFLFLYGLPWPEWIISFWSSRMDLFPLTLIFLGYYGLVFYMPTLL